MNKSLHKVLRVFGISLFAVPLALLAATAVQPEGDRLAYLPTEQVYGGYESLTFTVDGSEPLQNPTFAVANVGTADELESFARTQVYEFDQVEEIASIPKGIEITLSGDQDLTATAMFDGNNGVEVEIETQSDTNTNVLAQRIENATYVPPNTEITAYAKAHLIQAIVEVLV